MSDGDSHTSYTYLFGVSGDGLNKRAITKRLYLTAAIVAIIGIGLGFLMGWFVKKDKIIHGPCLGPTVPDKIIADGESYVKQMIIDRIDASNIKINLQNFTSFTHMSGTEGDDHLGNTVYSIWQSQGLDHVIKDSYEVLLSFPNTSDPSYVQIINLQSDQVIFKSQLQEKPLDPQQINATLPYNAYSAPGNITGHLVYVNYGRVEDFLWLQSNNVSIRGNIAIARYGKIYRGDKASLAEKFGAIGLILYTDPADFSNKKMSPYPDSWYMPDTGVQRGSIYTDTGDPLTPGYPSKSYSYRLPEKDALLPKIPVHPISYGDAEHLLKCLSGLPAPSNWTGGLNIDYYIGPTLTDPKLTIHLHVTTYNKHANITNVIGFINGSIEPDQYVILGNHRDAWVFGAVDPTSGTATMVELSRVVMTVVNQGWRPRRTLVFCSWAAEEFGLTGSTEWVEEFRPIIRQRAVAYLNVDFTVGGNDAVWADCMPLLYETMYDAAKSIETPNMKGQTIYDEWLEVFPEVDENNKATGLPRMGVVSGSSDYLPFSAFAGVTVVDFFYTYRPSYTVDSYPLYHSIYDDFNMVHKFMDPDFQYSAAIGKFWGVLARSLADSYILPLKVSSYPRDLYKMARALKRDFGPDMTAHGINLDELTKAVDNLQSECEQFEKRLTTVNKNNPLEVKRYNDQMIMMERAFLDPTGLPLRPKYKHVIYAPSVYNGYGGVTFPGLVDLLATESSDPVQHWEKIKQHFAAVVFSIHSAANVLKSPVSFT